MAIINSYPTVTPATGDLVIGTDISTTPNSTKTFTVASINALAPQGTVTSVAITMPAAFSVSGSPVTSSGTLAITGAGSNAQLIDGTGALQTIANLPFVDGTGTTNTIPIWSDSDTLSNSFMTYDSAGQFIRFGGGVSTIQAGSMATTDVAATNVTTTNITGIGGGTVNLKGNTIIGDANTDTLTVTAAATFSEQVTIPTTPVASTDAASKSYVDGIVGYTTYVARVSQTGTNAPVAVVISNNTGLTFTWSRTGVGSYRVTPSSSFVVNKTWIQMTGGDVSVGTTIVTIKDISTAFATAVNSNLINGAAADEITAAFVEIRIYP